MAAGLQPASAGIVTTSDDAFDRWLAGAEERYLADLTRREVGRALRALSSCYVERREKLATGHALEGRGKRAAFALYYGPLHFLTVREIARAVSAGLKPQARQSREIVVDIGCGTGAAGAAWALETGAEVRGFDVSAWAVEEANWTYRTLGVRGHARRGTVAGMRLPATPSTILAALTSPSSSTSWTTTPATSRSNGWAPRRKPAIRWS